MKLPNVGDPSFEVYDGLKTKVTMYMQYTESQYLLKSRELRWVLEGNSQLSDDWGGVNSFGFFVAVDDAGTAFFNTITQKLTVAYRDPDSYDVQYLHLRDWSSHI